MKRLIILIIVLGLPLSSASALPVVLDYVPAYSWYHGCGPSAAASIIGYWDLHGYDGLFEASGWEQVRYTKNVKEQISSTAHNQKYDSKPDNPDKPAPPDTSLADFWHTSEGDLGYGWSYTSYMDDVYRNYALFQGYDFESAFFISSWENLVAEINGGNPVSAYVDSNGDGTSDHFIPIMGYEDRGEEGLFYAAYNTWHESEMLDWYIFGPASSDYAYGITSMVYIHPLEEGLGGLPSRYSETSAPGASNPVPEPATLLLLGVGLMSLIFFRRRGRQTAGRYP